MKYTGERGVTYILMRGKCQLLIQRLYFASFASIIPSSTPNQLLGFVMSNHLSAFA